MRYTPDFIKRIYDFSPVWVRDIFGTCYGFLKKKKEKDKLFRRYLTALRESESWNREKLEELQNSRLRKIIRHCSENVPYYRELFAENGIDPRSIRTRKDLEIIPLLSKEDILNNTDRMIAEGYSKKRLLAESSSGTTGKPLTVYWDKKDYTWSVAARHIVTERMGYREGQDWLAIMNGYQIIPRDRNKPPFWINDYYNRTTHFSAYHISARTVEEYHRYIKEKGIKYILGYSSVVGLIARLMADRGLILDIDSVMLSSEPFYEWQLDAIEKAFPSKIINSYGQAERVALGGSCGDTMNIHLFDELGIVEFIQSRKHQNRSMVATSLVNYAMPLIRYELGDISDFSESRCACGSAHTTILPVSTKSEDFVVTPEGKFISASLLTFPFKHPEGIVESQLVQREPEKLTVNLTVNQDYSRDYESRIRRNLISMLGENMDIGFNYMDHIPRTANGKFRFVISEVEI